MGEAMVTGRMAPGKKRRGGLILQREGLTASQAINRMYDRLIENGDASFLTGIVAAEDEAAWDNAVEFVDSLSEPSPDAVDAWSESDEDEPEPEAAERQAAMAKPSQTVGSRSASKLVEAPSSDGPDLGAIARAARFSMRGVI